MKKFLLSAVVAISLFAIVRGANAQTVNKPNVNGVAGREIAGGGVFFASDFDMKLCKADANLKPQNTPFMCTNHVTAGNGLFGFTVNQGIGIYYVYLWRNDIFWGSSSYPIGWVNVGNSSGGNTFFPNSQPRALPPSGVNPTDGTVNVPTSFTLRWTDGLDAQRRDPRWPVTYDIWASGNDFPEVLVFSGIPCNGVGTCSVNVSNLVYTTRYQWYVVARIKSAPLVFRQDNLPLGKDGEDNLYKTQSQTFRFSTMMDPNTPSYSIRTANGHYLTAPGGGGGDFNATASSIDWQSTFKIVDTNGGTLESGDAIHIQTNRNYYLMAWDGGGGGVTTSAWAMGWETFTILKISAYTGDITYGPIQAGDQIALVSADGLHYVAAEGGGGGAVNADRWRCESWETFTLVVN